MKLTATRTVTPAVNFMPDQSRTEARRGFWVYHIRIENRRADTIQLRTRHWRITDSRGMVSLVDGEGVVGETPVLAPGATHDYVSGCELMTNMGSMEGHYTFVDEADHAARIGDPPMARAQLDRVGTAVLDADVIDPEPAPRLGARLVGHEVDRDPHRHPGGHRRVLEQAGEDVLHRATVTALPPWGKPDAANCGRVP